MKLLAHSARPGRGVPAQKYEDHIRRVIDLANENVQNLVCYSKKFGGRLAAAVPTAAECHDLGKLAPPNQDVLASGSSKKSLPLNHVDAGAAALMEKDYSRMIATTLVYSHHHGLPDFVAQGNRGQENFLRDREIKSITDAGLSEYVKAHNRCLGFGDSSELKTKSEPDDPLSPLAFRFALSCLVHADHQDTAEHYGHIDPAAAIPLNPEQRLELLDNYVRSLAGTRTDERTRLRKSLYETCRNADIQPSMYACDAPVGTGKTTAVMAHLLNAAKAKNLRRIFVVLPFTNIINQSVHVYRESLAMDFETFEHVVGAHHHRAEFDHPDSRHLTMLWKSPVIATTAVQFFETLAASSPAALRKLHQLPGSAIFLDESHAALPARLLPQAWMWLRELADEWGCHIVLGSGSLNRFWELEDFAEPTISLPDLVDKQAGPILSSFEESRIEYRSFGDAPVKLDDLLSLVLEEEGPGLLIVNTVQSAAHIASTLAERVGRENVEHISTALCPRDREKTLNRVLERLDDKTDKNWTLVATSCVEAGVDMSFRNGFRERCSLNSLLQTGGRVNRNNEFDDSKVIDFELVHAGMLKNHPGFDESTRVLRELFSENLVGPEHCTKAMLKEVRYAPLGSDAESIIKNEKGFNFPEISKMFRVIESETFTAVVDPDLINRLESGQKVQPDELMRKSVQIYTYRKNDYALKEFDRAPGLYAWTLGYDDFLGYMAGVLDMTPQSKGAYFA